MLVTRSNTPLSIIPKSFGPTRILIPKAPAAGLLLQKPVFGRYNREISGRPDREPIDFDKYSVSWLLIEEADCSYSHGRECRIL